ncbi:MAG: carbohydrate-binding family 9-like protein, partial [Clostridia bacterium]|nr:carbohydrate-binding family 9-like protein [Clostridia bacterium]
MMMKPVQLPRIPLDPPVYFCPRAKGRPVIDGDIDKPFWRDVPFTAPFVDISGPDFPAPRFLTRAKLCWD